MKKLLLLFTAFIAFHMAISQSASWTQSGSDIDGTTNDGLGGAISMSNDGTIVAIGAASSDADGTEFSYRGIVKVYQLQSGEWVQRGSTIKGTEDGASFGQSVSMSNDGSVLVIGAPRSASFYGEYSNSGIVKFFRWNATSEDWDLEETLDAAASGNNFGYAVSVSGDGNVVAIGAPFYTSSVDSEGRISVYEWSGTAWSLREHLDGSVQFGGFGNSVSLDLDGNVLATGAPSTGGSFGGDGEVKIHNWNGSAYISAATFSGGADDNLGHALSLSDDGTRLAVSAGKLFGGTTYVRILDYSTSWTAIDTITSSLEYDGFGFSISLSGDGSTVAIGANGYLENDNENGRTEIYTYGATDWTKVDMTIVGEATNDGAGTAVGISGDGTYVAIGAPSNEGGGNIAGQVRVYEFKACTPPTLTVNEPDPRCGAGTVTFSATASDGEIQWYDAETGGTLLGTGTTFGQTISETTTYWVVTDNGVCVADRAPYVATINPLTEVSLGEDVEACGEHTLDAGVDNVSYIWALEGTFEMLGSQKTFTVTESGSYLVLITDQNGCENADTINVTIVPTPSLASVTTSLSNCEGETPTLTAVPSEGSEVRWYETGEGGALLHTGDTFTPDTPITSDTSFLAVPAIGVCEGEPTQVSVIVIPSFTVDLGEDQSQCGGTVTLDAGNAGATYLWSNEATTQTIEVSESGTYSVTVTKDGCEATDEVIITIDPVPTLTVTQPSSQCLVDGSVTLTLEATASAGAVKWYDAAEGGTELPSAEVTISETTSYWAAAVDGACASAREEVVVNVFPTPVVNLGMDQTQCGGTVTLDAGNPGATYLWSNEATTQAIEVTESGTYSVMVTKDGCEASDEVVITINPVPVLTVTQPEQQCLIDGSATVSLSATSDIGVVKWYDAPEGGVELTSTEVTISATTSYWAVAVGGDCESERQEVVASVRYCYSTDTEGELGDGSTDRPFLISNRADLKYLSENSEDWGYHFLQIADVQFETADFETAGDFYNNGEGFIPIGNSGASFSGTYAGDSNTISGLYINRPQQGDIGMFGLVSGGARIDNVGLINVEITGLGYIGGLIGTNNGAAVSNCYVTGAVAAAELDPANTTDGTGVSKHVGGLIGASQSGSVSNSYFSGTVSGVYNVGGLIGSNSTSVTNCYSMGTITGHDVVGGLIGSSGAVVRDCYSLASVTGTTVGGLIGTNNSTVSKCYATGSVTTIADQSGGMGLLLQSGGGLVASNYGDIINAYATGDVSGSDVLAGLVGVHGDLVGSDVATIINAYAAGAVSGSGGGLIGLLGNENHRVENSFWNTETTGQSSSAAGAGIGLTTAQLQTQDTLINAGWDLEQTWKLPNLKCTNGGHPIFQHQDDPDVDYTIGDIAKICSGEQATITITTDAPEIRWFSSNDPDATAVQTGNTFTTGAITETTSYWYEIGEGDCYKREEILVKVTKVVVTSEAEVPTCDSDEITLMATVEPTGAEISWYSSKTSTEVLATGKSYTLPSVPTQSVSYWIEAVYEGCVSQRFEAKVIVPNYCYSGGNGSKENPFQIANKQDLNYLKDNSYSQGKYHFIQTADIGYSDGEVFGEIWSFSGSYDGNNKTIDGLNLESGMFYSIEDGAELKNIRLTDAQPVYDDYTIHHQLGLLAITNNGYIGNCHVSGSISGNTNYPIAVGIGMLAGSNSGVIENSHAVGTISYSNSSIAHYIGGLVGVNNSIITQSSAKVDVTTGDYGEDIGGFVGANGGMISNSFASGNVSGEDELGGFAGTNGGEIINCYATGNVTFIGSYSSDGGGGFVGDSYSSAALLKNCYSTGTATGAGGASGFGDKIGNTENSFWDTETSAHGRGVTRGYGTISVTGKTTAEMHTQSTFESAGWDFTGDFESNVYPTWIMDNGEGGSGYPILYWQSNPTYTVSGTVTDENGEVFTAGKVSAFIKDRAETRKFDIDESGHYSLNLLAGTYYVKVTPDEASKANYFVTYLGSTVKSDFSTKVAVSDAPITVENIQMIAKSQENELTGEGKVRGRVLDGDGTTPQQKLVMGRILEGTPLIGVSVFLIRVSDDKVMTEVVTDANGDFEISGIPEGEYQLQVNIDGVAMDLGNSSLVISATSKEKLVTALVSESGIALEIEDVLEEEEPALGLEETGIKIYPNPVVGDYLYVSAPAEAWLTLRDVSGRVVLKRNFTGTVQLDVRGISPGIHLLEIETVDGKIMRRISKTSR